MAQPVRQFTSFVIFMLMSFATQMAGAQENLECNAQYSGVLDAQGVDDFLARYATEIDREGAPILPSFGVVCLDSPGGVFLEGLRLYEIIERSSAITLVQSGSVCYSACAIAFLAGGAWIGQGNTQNFNARILERGAEVGFHAPFTLFDRSEVFTGEQGNQIFDMAVQALAEASRLRHFIRADGPVMNDYIYNGFISTPASDFFKVETAAGAIFSGIEVRGLPFVEEVNEAIITQVCDTAVALFVHESRPGISYNRNRADEIIHLVSGARVQRRNENITAGFDASYSFSELVVDALDQEIQLWAVGGYPSLGHRNDEWSCIAEVGTSRGFYETWSHVENFLSISSFTISLVNTGRGFGALPNHFSSVSDMLEESSSSVLYRVELPNWAALPTDTLLVGD